MFAITDSKGFQITFDNGVILSVQFGPANYCENRSSNLLDLKAPRSSFHWKSKDAEMAILLPNGSFYPIDGEDVVGWQSVNDFCRLLEIAKSIKT